MQCFLLNAHCTTDRVTGAARHSTEQSHAFCLGKQETGDFCELVWKRYITFLFSKGKVHFQSCVFLCWIIPDTPTQSCDLPQISTNAWNRSEETCAAVVVKREKHILSFVLYIVQVTKLVHVEKEVSVLIFQELVFFFFPPVPSWGAARRVCVLASWHHREDLMQSNENE